MKTSSEWLEYFRQNLQVKRVDWNQSPRLKPNELKNILQSMQAWQLGETSEGRQLMNACKKYAVKTGDQLYVKAMELFIKEEQKHGNNLGKYLDMIGQPRIKKNWGDTLFRKIRHLNTSMESWTLAVITVESAAQVFYQCLKDATDCKLLKDICTDILVDEAAHIQFQQERMMIIFRSKTVLGRKLSFHFYKFFYFATSLVIWAAHKKVFKAGATDFEKYFRKMNSKYEKTIDRLKYAISENYSFQPC